MSNPELMTLILPVVPNSLVLAIGWWAFRKLIVRVEAIGLDLAELRAEHDTYKALGKCPIINSAKEA